MRIVPGWVVNLGTCELLRFVTKQNKLEDQMKYWVFYHTMNCVHICMSAVDVLKTYLCMLHCVCMCLLCVHQIRANSSSDQQRNIQYNVRVNTHPIFLI